MMEQDIRELFKTDKTLPEGGLPEGHQSRFEARLDALNKVEDDSVVQFDSSKTKSRSTSRFPWMKVAAILLVALSIGVLGYNELSTTTSDEPTRVVNLDKVSPNENTAGTPVFLSDVSPQFKKVEDYYMANINMELAKLQVNDENEELINSFMTQLAELDKEYAQLNRELQEAGVNEQTVNTLIANLQLRLELLSKLKAKLKQLKENQNENLQDATA